MAELATAHKAKMEDQREREKQLQNQLELYGQFILDSDRT